MLQRIQKNVEPTNGVCAEQMRGRGNRMLPKANGGGADGSNRKLRPEVSVQVRYAPKFYDKVEPTSRENAASFD